MKNLFYLIPVLLILSCGSEPKKEEVVVEKINVVAVNYPISYFAERIAGDLVQLDYPIPPDTDPAYWIPIDTALSIYQEADLILANGAEYAKWMKMVSLPASRIVNTTRAVSDKLLEVQSGKSHSHGAQGEHVHTGLAFTTWLDFEIAQAQALAVKNAFLNKLPDQKETIESNFAKLNEELAQLHSQLVEIGEELHEFNIVGSHPVYQYLAQAYNLHIHNVHFEPDEMPSQDQWHELEHELSHNPSKIMLWEDEPLSELRTRIENEGLQIVVFNPCGNKPTEGDFMSTMKENLRALKEIGK